MHASVGEAIGAMPAKNFNASYTKHCSTSSMVKCSNTALGMSCNSTVRYERDPSDYKAHQTILKGEPTLIFGVVKILLHASSMKQDDA